MKRVTKLLSILVALVIFLASCQKISDRTNARLIFKATGSPSKSASADIPTTAKSSSATLAVITLDDFFINVKDIEFEFDDDDDDLYDDDDLEFDGPYLLDVLSPEVSNGIVLDDFSLPNAILEEIEFNIALIVGKKTIRWRVVQFMAFAKMELLMNCGLTRRKRLNEFDDGQATSYRR